MFLLIDSSVGQKEFAWKGGNCFRSMTGCGGGFGLERSRHKKCKEKRNFCQNGLIYIFLHFTVFLKRNNFEIRVFSYHLGSNFPLLCRCFSHGMLQLHWRCRGGDEGDIARYFWIGLGEKKVSLRYVFFFRAM